MTYIRIASIGHLLLFIHDISLLVGRRYVGIIKLPDYCYERQCVLKRRFITVKNATIHNIQELLKGHTKLQGRKIKEKNKEGRKFKVKRLLN